MKYYPIFLDIQGKDCLVVGGGTVGLRKAVTLEKCGANVKIISDRFSVQFDELEKLSICFEQKGYEKKDIKGMFLVFAATNNSDLNQQIKKDAFLYNILCNVADEPDNSDFLLPSIVDRGDLVVAVSTSGSSPAMAKRISEDLGRRFGPEYAVFMEFMGNIRKRLLSTGHDPDEHRTVFYTLIDRGILEMIKANEKIKINAVLCDVLGKEFTYQDLVSSRSDE
jgi:precorrin-2 dehydrogenase